MNAEKLKRLQTQVRIGGKGTARRKKKVIHQTATTDDKKLQSSLKKLSVSTIPGIEEVNIIKDDLTVIHFNNPKAQASLSANTFAVTGHGETKKIVEMLPEILPQLGQETVVQLRMFANSMTGMKKASGGSDGGGVGGDANVGTNMLYSVEEEDDVPMLVSDFDEVAKVEAAAPAIGTTTVNTEQTANNNENVAKNNVDNKVDMIAVVPSGEQLSNTEIIDSTMKKDSNFQPLENLCLNIKSNDKNKQTNVHQGQINKNEKEKITKEAKKLNENQKKNEIKTKQKEETAKQQSKSESKTQKGVKENVKPDEIALKNADEKKVKKIETDITVENDKSGKTQQGTLRPANLTDEKQEEKQKQEKVDQETGKKEKKDKRQEQEIKQQQKQVDKKQNKEKSQQPNADAQQQINKQQKKSAEQTEPNDQEQTNKNKQTQQQQHQGKQKTKQQDVQPKPDIAEEKKKLEQSVTQAAINQQQTGLEVLQLQAVGGESADKKIKPLISGAEKKDLSETKEIERKSERHEEMEIKNAEEINEVAAAQVDVAARGVKKQPEQKLQNQQEQPQQQIQQGQKAQQQQRPQPKQPEQQHQEQKQKEQQQQPQILHQQQQQKQSQQQKQQQLVKKTGTPPKEKQKAKDDKQKVQDQQVTSPKIDLTMADVSIKTVALQSLQSSEKILGMVNELTRELPVENLKSQIDNKKEVDAKDVYSIVQQPQATTSNETGNSIKVEGQHIESASTTTEKQLQGQLLEAKLKDVEELLSVVVGPASKGENKKSINLDNEKAKMPKVELKENNNQTIVPEQQSKSQCLALMLQSQPTPPSMAQKTVVQQLDQQSSSTETAQSQPAFPLTPLKTPQSFEIKPNKDIPLAAEPANKQPTMAEILQSQPTQILPTAAATTCKPTLTEGPIDAQSVLSDSTVPPAIVVPNLIVKSQASEEVITIGELATSTKDVKVVAQQPITEDKPASKSVSPKQTLSPPKQLAATKTTQGTTKQQTKSAHGCETSKMPTTVDTKLKLATKPQSVQQQQQQQQQSKAKSKTTPNKSAPTTPTTPTTPTQKVSPEKLSSTQKPTTPNTKPGVDVTIKKANSPQKQQHVDAAAKSAPPKQSAGGKNLRPTGSNSSAAPVSGAVKKANTPPAGGKTNANTIGKQQETINSQATSVGTPAAVATTKATPLPTSAPATENTATTNTIANQPSTPK